MAGRNSVRAIAKAVDDWLTGLHLCELYLAATPSTASGSSERPSQYRRSSTQAQSHSRSELPARKSQLAFLAALMVVVVVAACGGGEERAADALPELERGRDTVIVIPSGAPLVLGVSIALTGPVGERGNEYLDAVVAGVERWKAVNGATIGGRTIEVVAEDDACAEPGAAAQASDRLLRREGLIGVIGPQCSNGVEETMRMYADAGVVVISGSATKSDLTAGQAGEPFFFRTAYRNDFEGALIGTFVGYTLEARLLYLVDDGSAFGVDLANAAQSVAEQTGVRVTRLSAPFGTVDFGEVVQAVLADQPDVVAYTGFNPDAALLYRQLRDADYAGVFGGGDGAASQGDFVEPVGAQAENVLFAGCRYPLADDALRDFRAVHAGDPGATFSGQYMDAAAILLDAVARVARETAEGDLVIEPRELRDAVQATHVPGVTGPIAFDINGDRVPEPGQDIGDVLERLLAGDEEDLLTPLGLVPCQVQDGELVALGGPGAAELRLP